MGSAFEVGRRRREAGEGDHRRDHRERSGHRRAPLADPRRHVAGDRRGQRERERPGDGHQADVRLAVMECLFEEERRQDEAAHVGEVREELGGDRKGEVTPAEPVERDERMARLPLDADEQWSMDCVVPSRRVLSAISDVYPLEPIERGNEPATVYRFADGSPGTGTRRRRWQRRGSSCS